MWEKFLVGSSYDNMKTIRTWTHGILILHPQDAVGVNTQFAVDSLVIIAY